MLFWLFSSSLFFVEGVAENGTLLLVQALIRHADRAPAGSSSFSSSQSEAVFFRGQGHLSDEGIDNAHRMGEQFRARYVDKGFIDGRLLPKQVSIRSSAVPRVLMSAGSFGAGLFSKTASGSPRVPPVLSSPVDIDKVLIPQIFDKELSAYVRAKYEVRLEVGGSNEIIGNNYGRIDGILEGNYNITGCDGVDIDRLEGIVAEVANPRVNLTAEMRKCAEGGARRYLHRFQELLSGSGLDRDVPQLRRIGGLLVKEMTTNMDRKVYGEDEESRMFVYYAHDTNIFALAEILGVLDSLEGKTTEFSSAILLELWRTSEGGEEVKVIVKNGVEAQFVEKEVSTFEFFMESMREYSPPDSNSSYSPSLLLTLFVCTIVAYW